MEDDVKLISFPPAALPWRGFASSSRSLNLMTLTRDVSTMDYGTYTIEKKVVTFFFVIVSVTGTVFLSSVYGSLIWLMLGGMLICTALKFSE